jgi:membrane protease YdiL (CAAX protease family)
LARHVGDVVSIVVTAFCFALVHAAQLANSWSPLLVLFLVGLVLTIARARSGSVAASALLHAGYNASIFVTMYAATAGFHHMERLPH